MRSHAKKTSIKSLVCCGAHAQVVFVNGRRDEGKSYLVKNYLLKKIPCRWFCWDINGEYTVTDFPHAKITSSFSDVVNAYNEGTTQIIFQPLDKTEAVFNTFCSYAFLMENACIVVEEIEQFATTHKIPYWTKVLIDRGKHRGLGLIATARRTMRTNGDIPFNAAHIISFKQARPQDVKYLSEYIGEEANKLPTLDRFWFLWYDGKETHLVEPI